ncbi:MAG TPA: alpha/beta fold hydrolase [Desulfobacteria bacterium]|nr:alpha/beta fold hydrolase [Desulfobacteria bacterium]
MKSFHFNRRVKFISAFVIGLILVLGILPVSVGLVLTHPDRIPVVIPASLGSIKLEPAVFQSRDSKVKLDGWFLPSKDSNRTVIFAHGYHNNRLQEDVPAIDIARILNSNSCNVLMFDFRSNGESEGSLTSLGQFEKEDLKGAVDYVKGLGKPGEHVGVIGFSMGAATALTAAAEDPRIEAVVADSPFADLHAYLEENLPFWSHLPSFPFTPVILKTLPAILDLQPETVSPIKALPKIKAPVLLIHGTGDKHIPVSNSVNLYKASPEGNNLWIVEGAVHVGSYKKQPQQYKQKVLSLFSRMK